MPLIFEFAQPDRKFLTEKVARVLRTVAKHVVDTEHLRLVVKDHACVRSDRHLTCRECIECIDRLVRRHVIRKVDQDVDLVSGEVIDLLDLDLSAFLCLEYRLDHHLRRLAVRHFCDGKGVLVNLLDLGADLYLSALSPAAVFRAVGRTSGKEIREYLEILALKHTDRCIYELVEVVRKNLRRESRTDTFCTLSQKNRKLHRKFYRLLISAVIRSHPVGGLRIEYHLLRELCESRLDITWSRVRVTGEDVTPVSLAVDEVVSLSDPYEGSEDGLVSMRMELHGLSDDVGHLGVASVVHTPHGMENTSLNRLQTIYKVWYSPIEDCI